MPLPPCFYLQQDLFPKVRAEGARHLMERGWSQTRVAQALRISQAMVSRYGRASPDHDPLVQSLVQQLLQDLEGDEGRTESPWCHTFGAAEDRPGAREALTDLLQAEHILGRGAPARLMPQVGLNIAVALPGAQAPRDVMSYPGRIIHADGRLVAPLPPTLGSSGHLARCLLLVRSRYPQVRAIANVRGSRAAAKAADSLATTWNLQGGDGEREEQLAEELERRRKQPAYVVDPGGFGIEPCIYVCGSDAAHVAKRILSLHDRTMHDE